MKNIKWKHYINYIAVAAVMIIFGTLSITGNLKQSGQFMLEKMSIAAILAVSLSLVVGFLGELSLGHAGFMCVGAYLGGKVSAVLVASAGFGKNSILALIISMLVGGAAAAVCGVIIGLPALRLKGDYLAIVTLAFGEIVRSIFLNTKPETFGGALGLDTPRFDRNYLFIIAFVLLLITLAVIQNLLRSKHGRAITAIRDSEIAARAMGINVTRYKLMTFTVSSFFAGIAGVLYSYSNYTLQSSKFNYNYSIEILVMVVLGGMGSINGALIASALITFLNLKLATILSGDKAVFQNLVYALILIVIVIYNNAPALKGFREKYNFKNLTSKIFKSKHDPAVEKNDEAQWTRIPTKINMDEILSMDVNVSDDPNVPTENNEGGAK